MLFILLAISLFVCKDIFGKFYGLNFEAKSTGLFLSNTLAMFSGSIVLFIVALCMKKAILLSNLTSFILAAVFGISYILVNYVLVMAMSYGPMGLTGVICGIGGLLAGSIYGLIRGDKASFAVIIGAVLMTLAVILVTPLKVEKNERSSNQMRWFILAFISFLLNALICIVKTEAVSYKGADSITFSLWAFIFATATGLVFIIHYLIKGERFKSYLGSKKNVIKFLSIACIMGISCTLANTMQMLSLASGVASIVVYPLTTVGANLIEAFVSVVILKDQKMSFKIYLAYAVCIIGIILVNIG